VQANTLVFGYKIGGKVHGHTALPLDKVKLIYENLPPEANTADIRKLVHRYNLNVPTHVDALLLRALSVMYNKKLKKEGSSLILYKGRG
jgi:hypothetical protein